ncbi:hypothetical protein PRIPAC_85214 [Pristionchus pacificus]|nr:hypothetical protein PRIPAC_85214 [Pristionchus pacificus]|eukprot:PDM66411.1 hypothetical protein PRIPAC_47828 [Pristionchus pacificus]
MITEFRNSRSSVFDLRRPKISPISKIVTELATQYPCNKWQLAYLFDRPQRAAAGDWVVVETGVRSGS